MISEQCEIQLTPREKTIVECLKQGKITDEDIADSLEISIPTVACFMQKLYEKFDLDNGQLRAKLVWEVMRWFVYVIKQIVKQIVKLCNDELEQETDPLNSSGMSLARKILNLLEIEEVNEE